MQRLEAFLSENRDRYEEELKAFLRIPSVSADHRYARDVEAAGEFVAQQMRAMGLATEVVRTERHPLVIGEWTGAAGQPTILVYGHYDVQPPDPLDRWITGPFEPAIRDGNIYARGATDDKGQMFTHLKAIEAWLRVAGKLPVNVRVLIEGEEEVGSESIEAYVRAHRDRLACDHVVISDSSMLGPDQPAITYGLRGIAYFELVVRGPRRDLHSGSFGGAVQNPANALAALVASLRDVRGRVAIEGFYDDVVEITAAERARIGALPFDPARYAVDLGLGELVGESGYTTLERCWVRPTCDVNGIVGGYTGEGAKTVIPASASAKVSFRLVPDQDPERVGQLLRCHVMAHRPPGVEVEVLVHSGATPVVVPIENAGIRAAARALRAAFGVEPVFIREGGTIPVVSTFQEVLGAQSLLLGFGLSDDNTHAPNEKLSLRDFHRGIRTSAHLLRELARPA